MPQRLGISVQPRALVATLALVTGACSLTTDLDPLEAAGAGGTSATASGGATGSGGASTTASTMSSTSTGGAGGAPVYDPPWWNTSWRRRVRLVISTNTTLAAGFEVAFKVDLPTVFGTRVFASSLRAMSWSAATASWITVPTYSEGAGGNIWVWLRSADQITAAAPLDHYWLYADNPTPPAADDPATVFTVLYKRFTDTAGFVSLGSPTLGGGYVELDADESVRSNATFSPDMAVDYSLLVLSHPTCTTSFTCWISGGFQRAGDFQNSEPWILWIDRGLGATVQPEASIAAISTLVTGATIPMALDDEHIFGVERFVDHARYRFDDDFMQTLPFGGSYPDGLQVRLSTVGPEQAKFGFARVRHAADPPPSVTPQPVEVFQ